MSGAAQRLAETAEGHRGLLFATALRLCRSRADADDLVQDTIERALRRPEQLLDGAQGRAWLLTILHHRFIDTCRRRREHPGSVPEAPCPAPDEPEDAPAWARVTPDQVREAVARLDPEFAQVYRLHADEGLAYDQIAARLGIPKATVGTRLLRARRKLKEILLQELEAET